MRTWAVGFILGSMLCLAGIFVWVGLQTLNTSSPKPEQSANVDTPVVEETEPDPVEEIEVAVKEPEPTPEPAPEPTPQPATQIPEAEEVESTEPAQVEEAPETTETVTVEEPAPAEPEIEAAPEPEVVEEPAPEAETGIKIGQGNSSRLPKITEPQGGTAEPEITPVEVEDNTPKLAIVLVDPNEDWLEISEIEALDYPVALAVSPARDDASERSTQVADAGKTVLALSPENVEFSLSGNLSNRQVATLLNRYFAIMPEAIGLLDRPEATLQVDRQLSKAVVARFKNNGKSLITYQKGLNSLLKDASNEGVPASKIYRSLDSNGEDEAAILRLLDRAVLEASQNGQAIVQGSASLETLDAIEKWRGTSRASTVSLVSITKVLPKVAE